MIKHERKSLAGWFFRILIEGSKHELQTMLHYFKWLGRTIKW